MTDENGKFLEDWRQSAFNNTLEKGKNKSLDELKKDRTLYACMCGPVANSKIFNKVVVSIKEGSINALNLLIQEKSE